MHRVIAVQSLKFLEQRQQQSAFSIPPLSQQPQPNQPPSNADSLSALNSPSHVPNAASSAQPLVDGAGTSDTIISIKDYSSHLDERTPASSGAPGGHGSAANPSAADSAAQHEKTITIIYHDKKDANNMPLSTASSYDRPTAHHNKLPRTQHPTSTSQPTPPPSTKPPASTLIIDELIRRKRDKLNRSPRGVWCSLGVAYVSKGDVDTEVGSVGGGRGGGGVREMTRGRRRAGPGAGAGGGGGGVAGGGGVGVGGSGGGGEATRKVERLVELFRQSRVKMLQTSHEAIREREKERERDKEREIQRRENRRSSMSLLPSAAALPPLDSHDPTPLSPRPATANSTSSNPPTQSITHPANTHPSTHTTLLPGGVTRLEYIARWRQAFDETKQALDRALIKRMVDRAEGRRRRMRDGVTAREVEEMVTRGGKRGGGGGGGGRRERGGGRRGQRLVAGVEEEEKTQIMM